MSSNKYDTSQATPGKGKPDDQKKAAPIVNAPPHQPAKKQDKDTAPAHKS
jgi:hypothetical protein